MVQYLRQKFATQIAEGRFELIESDILKADLTQWGPAPIAGNLPYYITSPILEKVFATGPVWTQAVFLVQAEVATRICAGPGSRDYGYLSVLVQAQAKPERVCEVPAAAFRPPPKVESAVVKLTPYESGIEDIPKFLKFASVCFRMKRKTLRNNLSTAYPKEVVDALPEAKLRAEQLPVSELVRLSKVLESPSRPNPQH